VMLAGGIGAVVHAFVPALCKTSGSDTVKRLHARLTGDPARGAKRPDYEI